MRIFTLLLILLILTGCSSFQRKKTLPPSKPETKNYIFKDRTGEFLLERKSVLNADKKMVIVKQVLSTGAGEDEIGANTLEESISYSTPGTLKDKINILRPAKSVYSVWFDKKKYTTEMKLNIKTKKLDITVNSPEEKYNGTKQLALPRKSTGVFCFFSQMLECVRATDFFNKAIDNEAGTMNFHMIWENYPFHQELYSEFPNEVFSQVSLEYDGKNSKGEYRFTLQLPNQTIFYFLDKNAELLKMFWVAQGVSMVRQDKEADLDETENIEEE